METKLNDIKLEIEQIIQNINDIICEEDFSAYYDIKNSLKKASDFISEHKILEAKKHVQFSIRLLKEAPPRNKSLGLDTLTRMRIIDEKTQNLID